MEPGIRGIINRCGVIAGPWQFGKIDQGVFSLWVIAHYFNRYLKYIGFGGNGKQVRDLLHIDDLFELIEVQTLNMENGNGKIYNVGGGVNMNLSLCETTGLCEEITGKKINIDSDLNDRSADIIIYISDNCKVIEDFSWCPKRKPKKTLEDIYCWIKENEKDLSAILNTDK